MVLHIEAPLLKWGNSYALRITREQARQLGVRPGETLQADINGLAETGEHSWNFPVIPALEGGPTDWSTRHDEMRGRAAEEEWKKWQQS